MSHSSNDGYAKVNGLDLYYKIVGDRGHPLLLIMGLSFSHLDWGQTFLDLLSQEYKVILFDNRDAGKSSEASTLYSITNMMEDTSDLMDALNITEAHIFGVSMGGMIAQQLALKYPQKVSKLILGCTTCSFQGLQGLDTKFLEYSLLELLFTPEYIKAHESELKTFLQSTTPSHSQPDGLMRQLGAIATHNICDIINQIDIPTLVMTGDRDLVISDKNSKVIASVIPKAQLEVIKNGAHAFCYSHAQESALLIHQFLK